MVDLACEVLPTCIDPKPKKKSITSGLFFGDWSDRKMCSCPCYNEKPVNGLSPGGCSAERRRSVAFSVEVNGTEVLQAEGPVQGLEILSRSSVSHPGEVVAWRVNGYLRTLRWELDGDARVEFVDTSSFEGMEVYRRTLSFLLVALCRRLEGVGLYVRHSISDGYYCELETGLPGEGVVAGLRKGLEELVARNDAIEREVFALDKACRILEGQGNGEKARLLRFVGLDPIELYRLDGTYGFYYAPLAPSTGVVKSFDLVPFDDGMVLRFPTVSFPDRLPPFQVSRKLTGVFREYSRWLDILDVGTMESLHRKVAEGKAQEMILVSEALHAQRFGHIAEEIVGRRDVRLICMAGPSGSGKTTSAHRLEVQLKVCGKRPVTLSLDDYFVDRAHTPLDEEGRYDFEALEALDLELINDHLTRLLAGGEVSLPRFDFITGRRTSGKSLRLGDDDILIVEGIHGLNDRLTEAVSEDRKYRIYVSCLTGVNFDLHNRTSTTDNRLLRRMVRDFRLRGKSPETTLRQWPSVIRGAYRHIFPYQERADVMFNSALIYELSALKALAEPLIRGIPQDSEVYGEARRLLGLLRFVPFIPTESVPGNSILREFVGGSCFDV